MKRLTRRSTEELRHMRAAGRVVAEMHQAIRAAARPGVTTLHLDRVGRDVLASRNATSNFLGYHGFPAVICASVNDEVVHGIPNERPLRNGDIVSIDCGAIVNGWHGDAAFTMAVGEIDDDAQRLIDAADRALDAAIAAMQPGGHLGDVGAAVESVVNAAGYGSPRDYCGHGIGRAMHEDPDVENRGRRGKGPRLEAGVVLAIEPMLIAGGRDDVVVLDDDWTVVTADGSLAAHTEHTVVITSNGPEILTRL
ncbi:MAG TPA: type I methionyl aminopeptidase [Ilumatobacteraceae bacterium]|jgi:methionyl aminopeptidase|nr:type I methionyl aminopeptidase [Ilumatobacteraceae bacterium]